MGIIDGGRFQDRVICLPTRPCRGQSPRVMTSVRTSSIVAKDTGRISYPLARIRDMAPATGRGHIGPQGGLVYRVPRSTVTRRTLRSPILPEWGRSPCLCRFCLGMGASAPRPILHLPGSRRRFRTSCATTLRPTYCTLLVRAHRPAASLSLRSSTAPLRRCIQDRCTCGGHGDRDWRLAAKA